MDRVEKSLFGGACLAFAWAVLGNYVALPGYLRFLARGGTSEAGNAFDADVAMGALRTISWMLAFNVGALCLYILAVRRRCPEHLGMALAISVSWLVFWSWPALPRPGPGFFLGFGSVILVAILVVGYRVSRPAPHARAGATFPALTAFVFFAMATWDVCGLGSVGRILHPEEVVLERSQLLLQTQVVKLMLALVIGWWMAALALQRAEGRSVAATG